MGQSERDGQEGGRATDLPNRRGSLQVRSRRVGGFSLDERKFDPRLTPTSPSFLFHGSRRRTYWVRVEVRTLGVTREDGGTRDLLCDPPRKRRMIDMVKPVH